MSGLRKSPICLSAFSGDKFITSVLLSMLSLGSISKISNVLVWLYKKGCLSTACSADTGKVEWIYNTVDTNDGFRKELAAYSVHSASNIHLHFNNTMKV